ncbi:MAG: ClbS/DfsB family four-helix bundle protein [Anaerolineae bacterium]|nr:ClbS/DfsB family four-helix bundle protein [Anaerolineae bacterium]
MKDQLLELIAYAQSVHRAFMDGLSDERRNDPGTWELWSAKDNVVHANFYMNRSLERTEKSLRGEEVDSSGELEETNKGIFNDHHADTWDQVRADSERIFARLIALITSLNEEQLTQNGHFSWARGALGGNFISHALVHPTEHFTTYQIQQGEQEKAVALNQQVVGQLKTVDDLFPYGYSIYNLACTYAKAGLPDQALALLPEALNLQPDLKDWAPQDPDLISLRDLPPFQQLLS